MMIQDIQDLIINLIILKLNFHQEKALKDVIDRLKPFWNELYWNFIEENSKQLNSSS